MMKNGWKALLAAATALALSLSLAPAALAHGPSSHGGARRPRGPRWAVGGSSATAAEFVLGGVAFLGVLYALKRRRG